MTWLRSQGFAVDICERWLPHVNRRRDLFNIIDLIAIRPGQIVGVQATSLSNVPARVAKAKASPFLGAWLASGAQFWVIGWAHVNGGWRPKVVEFSAADVCSVTVRPPQKRRKDRHRQGELFGPADAA